jgi:hypothetical protein
LPTGPKGEKRPADVIGTAVKIMRIATGEEPEDYGDAPAKNQAAAEFGDKLVERISVRLRQANLSGRALTA